MPKKKAKRIFRKVSEKERRRIKGLQDKLDEELPDLKVRAWQYEQARETAALAIEMLRLERERQGKSLADMLNSTGMGRDALCRMENNDNPNPTVRTLSRYASALGMGIQIKLVKAK